MTDQSAAKRLRSSEPDLQIILGSDDDVVTKWCHSPTLASKSKYIDAMLAAPMQESENRTITFPDISPEVWDNMIMFLDDPVAARRMTAKDALAVAVFYDKYEFEQGRKLCEDVMMCYFEKLDKMEKNYSLNLELVIDLTVTAHQANLNNAFVEGIEYLSDKMGDSGDETYGRTMFTKEHLNRILPLFKHSSRNEGGWFEVDGGWRNFDNVDEPGYAKEFVIDSHKFAYQTLLTKCISHIQVSGISRRADGVFRPIGNGLVRRYEAYDRPGVWGRQRAIFQLKYIDDDKTFEGWAIVCF
jgi:hypothetical protein